MPSGKTSSAVRPATNSAGKFCAGVPNWECFDSETERLQFWFYRNLSLIVPLYGVAGSLLKTELIICAADLYANAASNEAYFDSQSIFSVLPWMEGQLP